MFWNENERYAEAPCDHTPQDAAGAGTVKCDILQALLFE